MAIVVSSRATEQQLTFASQVNLHTSTPLVASHTLNVLSRDPEKMCLLS
jgi:hypothetical protein